MTIAATRLLVAEWQPLVFIALLSIGLILAAAVVLTGRRSALRRLGDVDAADLVVAILVPLRSGLWAHAGGRGAGGWIQEWVLVISGDKAWAARGDRLVELDVERSSGHASAMLNLRTADRAWELPCRSL